MQRLTTPHRSSGPREGDPMDGLGHALVECETRKNDHMVGPGGKGPFVLRQRTQSSITRSHSREAVDIASTTPTRTSRVFFVI